jgi:hypothetical protein
MMRSMRFGVWTLIAAGCGRIGFTSEPLDDGMVADSPEVPVDAPPVVAESCKVTKPGVLLCEDFEEPSVSWDYTIFDQGSAARSIVRAANGFASLEANINGSNNFKAARWGKNNVLPSLTGGDLYIREWIYLASPTVVTDQLSILVAGNQVDPFPSVNLLLRPGQSEVGVEGQGINVDFEFPRDKWVCVQLHVVIDDANGSIELAIDGQPVIDSMGGDTAVAGGYTNLDAGFHYATPTQSAARMFVDEIVADTSPISCD